MKRKNTESWKVTAGSFVRHYATAHHAEQMARALRLNGMDVTVTTIEFPTDPLTRLILLAVLEEMDRSGVLDSE